MASSYEQAPPLIVSYYRAPFQMDASGDTEDRLANLESAIEDLRRVRNKDWLGLRYWLEKPFITGLNVASLSAEEVTSGLIQSATTGWRAEMGNATYPFRYWDGTNTRFSVDNTGLVSAVQLQVTNVEAATAALRVTTAGGASDVAIEVQGGTYRVMNVLGDVAVDWQGQMRLYANLASDVFPKVQITEDDNSFQFGAGGVTALDWKLSRTAANEATIASGDKLVLSGRGPVTDEAFAFFLS